MITEMDPLIPETANSKGVDKIIFVVGNSRSGTTLMGRILGSNPEVFTLNELHFFEQLWQPCVPAQVIPFKQASGIVARLLGIQRDGYYEQADTQKYLDEIPKIINETECLTPPNIFARVVSYEALLHRKQVACDQTPRNLYYLKEILEFYPQAYIINMIRDPRGVLLSQKNRWRRRKLSGGGVPLVHSIRQWVDYHPITISLIWANGVKVFDRMANHMRVRSIRFEDLLANPKAEILQLCEFLHLEFTPEMLDVPQVGSSLNKDISGQYGINSGVSEQWRKGGLSNTELWICQMITKTVMQRQGYALMAITPNWAFVIWSSITWIIKSGLAFIFNFRRARNPIEAAGRRLGFYRNR